MTTEIMMPSAAVLIVFIYIMSKTNAWDQPNGSFRRMNTNEIEGPTKAPTLAPFKMSDDSSNKAYDEQIAGFALDGAALLASAVLGYVVYNEYVREKEDETGDGEPLLGTNIFTASGPHKVIFSAFGNSEVAFEVGEDDPALPKKYRININDIRSVEKGKTSKTANANVDADLCVALMLESDSIDIVAGSKEERDKLYDQFMDIIQKARNK